MRRYTLDPYEMQNVAKSVRYRIWFWIHLKFTIFWSSRKFEKILFWKVLFLNFSTKDVEDELAELENSFDIFGSDAVLEVLEKAIGFECQNLDADEALYILNSVQNFSHFDHSPRMGCIGLFCIELGAWKLKSLMDQISTRYQGEKLSLLKTKANSNVSFAS